MNDELVQLTADIVSAYVSKNAVPAAELAGVITSVHQFLGTLKEDTAAPIEEQQKPSVNPKRSVHNDYVVCLEDGGVQVAYLSANTVSLQQRRQ